MAKGERSSRVRMMAKPGKNRIVTRRLAASALTQKDADRFDKQAKTYAASVTASKKKARSKLVSLGINTRSGRLSKRYG